MAKTSFLSLAFLIFIVFAAVAFDEAPFQQVAPSWTSPNMRDANYPSSAFFTGYVQGNVRQGETLEAAKQRLIRDAQGLLTESIRVTVRSHTASQTVSTRTAQNERIDATFSAAVETASDAEITGLNTEQPYHDQQTGLIHAFAWVNRFELSGYHRANITMNLTQAEGLAQTAHDLEQSGEKARARQQCQAAIPLLVKVRQSQELLTAIDGNASPESLHLPRTETLHNRLAQMNARLAQAVSVHVESVENNFARPTSLVANRLKSTLATKGCSFTEDPRRADFRLKIEANTRHHGTEYGMQVCFADVSVSLFDVRRNRSVFEDEFSQKGIASTQEAAGRKALEDAAPAIANKISQWIE